MIAAFAYGESCYYRLKNRNYDDSFGSHSMSDYVDYAEDLHEEPSPEEEDEQLMRYSRRQRQIILSRIPKGRAEASLHELRLILNKAEASEDEYVINLILEGYRDKLDEDTYDVPHIDPDEFDDILSKFSSF